jgi:hypothetical protein
VTAHAEGLELGVRAATEHAHGMPAREAGLDDRAPEEAAAAGDEDPHEAGS